MTRLGRSAGPDSRKSHLAGAGLRADRAVLLLLADPPTAGEGLSGRAEHISSGRFTEFRNARELIAFLVEMQDSYDPRDRTAPDPGNATTIQEIDDRPSKFERDRD
jgi:hypothetical protein